MSFLTRKERIFFERTESPESVSSATRKRSEGRMKTYPSAVDCRAWCLDNDDRRKYFLELIEGSPPWAKKCAIGDVGQYVACNVLIEMLLEHKLGEKVTYRGQHLMDQTEDHVLTEMLPLKVPMETEVRDGIEEDARFKEDEQITGVEIIVPKQHEVLYARSTLSSESEAESEDLATSTSTKQNSQIYLLRNQLLVLEKDWNKKEACLYEAMCKLQNIKHILDDHEELVKQCRNADDKVVKLSEEKDKLIQEKEKLLSLISALRKGKGKSPESTEELAAIQRQMNEITENTALIPADKLALLKQELLKLREFSKKAGIIEVERNMLIEKSAQMESAIRDLKNELKLNEAQQQQLQDYVSSETDVGALKSSIINLKGQLKLCEQLKEERNQYATENAALRHALGESVLFDLEEHEAKLRELEKQEVHRSKSTELCVDVENLIKMLENYRNLEERVMKLLKLNKILKEKLRAMGEDASKLAIAARRHSLKSEEELTLDTKSSAETPTATWTVKQATVDSAEEKRALIAAQNKLQCLERELLDLKQERDKLSMELQHKKMDSTDCAELEKLLSNAYSERDGLQRTVVNMEAALNELKHKYDNVVAERDTLRMRLQDYLNTDSELERLRFKAKEADVLRIERDRLKIRVDELANIEAAYTDLLDKYKGKGADCEKQLMKRKLKDLECTIVDQEEEITKLLLQLERLASRSSRDQNSTCNELRADSSANREDSKDVIEKLKRELDVALGKLTAKQAEYDYLKSENEKIQTEIQALKSWKINSCQCENMEEEKIIHEEAMKSLQDKFDKEKITSKELLSKCENMENQLTNHSAILLEKDEQLKLCKAETEDLLSGIENLKRELDAEKAKDLDFQELMQKSCEDLESQLRNKSAILLEKDEQLKLCKVETEELLSGIANLKKELDAEKAKALEFQELLWKSQTTAEDLTKEKESLQNELRGFSKEYSLLRKETTTALERQTPLKNQITALSDELNKEREKVQNLKKILNENETATKKHIADKEQLSTELINVNKECNNFREENKTLLQKLADYEQNIKKYRQEVQVLVNKLKELESSEKLKPGDSFASTDLTSELHFLKQERDDLAKQLQCYEEEIKDLRSAIDAFQSEIMDSKQKDEIITDLKVQIEEYVKVIEYLQKQMHTLEEMANNSKTLELELMSEREHKTKMESLLREMEEELKAAKMNAKKVISDDSSMKKLQDLIDCLKGKCELYENEIKRLKEQTIDNAEVAALEVKVRQLEEISNKENARSLELQNTVNNLMSELAAAKLRANEREQKIQDLEETINNVDTDAGIRVNKLQANCISLENELEAKKARINELESRVQELEDALVHNKVKTNELENNIRHLNSELEAANKNVMSLQNNVASAEKENVNMNAVCNDLQNRIKTLENELESAISEVKTLQEKLKETGLESQLQDKVQILEQELTAARTREYEQANKMNELEKALSKAKAEVNNSENKLKKITEEANALEKTVKYLQEALENAGTGSEELEDKVKILQEELSYKNERINMLESTIVELNDTLKNDARYVEELENRIKELEDDLKLSKNDSIFFDKLKKQFEDELEESGKRIKELSAENEVLEKNKWNTMALEAELEKLKQTNRELVGTISDYQQMIKTTEDQMTQIQEESSNLQNAFDERLKEREEECENKLLTMKEEFNRKLENANATYEADMKALKDRYREINEKMKDLEAENLHKSSTIQKLKEKQNLDLQKYNAELQKAYEELNHQKNVVVPYSSKVELQHSGDAKETVSESCMTDNGPAMNVCVSGATPPYLATMLLTALLEGIDALSFTDLAALHQELHRAAKKLLGSECTETALPSSTKFGINKHVMAKKLSHLEQRIQKKQCETNQRVQQIQLICQTEKKWLQMLKQIAVQEDVHEAQQLHQKRMLQSNASNRQQAMTVTPKLCFCNK